MPKCCYKLGARGDQPEQACQFPQEPSTEVGGAHFCRFHLPYDSNQFFDRTKVELVDGGLNLKCNWPDDQRAKFSKECVGLIARGENLAGLVAAGPFDIAEPSSHIRLSDAYFPSTFRMPHRAHSVDMWRSTFAGPVVLNAPIQNSLDLSESRFLQRAEFRSALTATKFDQCVFHGPVDFRTVVFNKSATFAGCKFHDGARFEDADFSGALTVSFDRSHFMKRVSFRAGAKPSLNRAFFRSAVFEGHAGFEGREFRSSLIFRNAKFHHAPRFQDAKISFESVFPGLDGFLDWRLTPKEVSGQAIEKQHEYFEGASQAYRTLRYAMRAQDAHDEEARFWELEMRTKERALAWSASEWLPKLFSKLYGLTARYGNSIARPLCWWAAVWAVFAFVIYASFQWPGVLHGAALQLSDFSFQQTIRPFGVWSEEGKRTVILLIGEGASLTDAQVLALRVLATVQSVVSLTLIALFGFAVRRRFRMA
jgi:uncharacterized protein YjbI with pentapeptide repeats